MIVQILSNYICIQQNSKAIRSSSLIHEKTGMREESKLLWFWSTFIKSVFSVLATELGGREQQSNGDISSTWALQSSAGMLLRTGRGSALWYWCLRCWCCGESPAGSCSSQQKRRELERLTDLPARRKHTDKDTVGGRLMWLKLLLHYSDDSCCL